MSEHTAENDATDCGCINSAGWPMHNHDGTRWHYQTCPLALTSTSDERENS